MTRGEALSTLLLLAVVVGIAALLYWYWAPALPVGPGSSPELADDGPPTSLPEAKAAEANGAGDEASVTATGTAEPLLAPFCAPGRRPTFVLGFAQLKARLGETMGEPVECEHINPDNGDILQHTNAGIAIYRQDARALEFTDGWRHWMLIGDELITWEGDDGG